jgi:hypothetical protein
LTEAKIVLATPFAFTFSRSLGKKKEVISCTKWSNAHVNNYVKTAILVKTKIVAAIDTMVSELLNMLGWKGMCYVARHAYVETC